MNDKILEVKHIFKKRGHKRVLENINFSINKGEICGFVGRNGAGKTTLIKIITSMLYPDEGEVIICGKNLKTEREEALRNVGAVVETPVMYGYMTGRQNLNYVSSVIKGAAKYEIDNAIKFSNLGIKIDEKVKKYSLGMKQRLGLAEAMMGNIVGIMTIIVFIIIFFLSIWRRISYVSKIKSTVRNIAEGNLYSPVPLKYKNELRELAEDINYMASKIEKEEKNRNAFLTNIAHDLRTPLTTILGYVSMIKNDKYESKDELNNYIDIMEKKGAYLKNMLDDFFEYSKLSSNDIVLEKQGLEVNELARQIFEEEEEEFIQNGLKLSLDLPQESIYIEAEPNLFLRAVNNLLINALKYSKENTIVQFSVNKEIFHNRFYAVLWISNIPYDLISDNDLENLFERLYKKDLSRQKEGSGLGLSIVKNIIRLHGGFVKVYKESNKLVFKIYHPC